MNNPHEQFKRRAQAKRDATAKEYAQNSVLTVAILIVIVLFTQL